MLGALVEYDVGYYTENQKKVVLQRTHKGMLWVKKCKPSSEAVEAFAALPMKE